MSLPVFHRLLYISRAHIDPCGPEPRRILDVSTQRNASMAVTGLPCFSGDHFAQVLEGMRERLELLMVSIRADVRHQVLREWPARSSDGGGRWYPGWSMAYAYDERLEHVAARLVADPRAQMPLDALAPLLFSNLELYRGAAPGSAPGQASGAALGTAPGRPA